MPSTDSCIVMFALQTFVWCNKSHLTFTSGHQDITYLILLSRNSVLEDDEMCIKHRNITKISQFFSY